MIGLQKDQYGYGDLLSEMRAVTRQAQKLRAVADAHDLKLNELLYMKIRLEYTVIAEDAAAVFHKMEYVKTHDKLNDNQRETVADEFARMMFAIVETSQKL